MRQMRQFFSLVRQSGRRLTCPNVLEGANYFQSVMLSTAKHPCICLGTKCRDLSLPLCITHGAKPFVLNAPMLPCVMPSSGSRRLWSLRTTSAEDFSKASMGLARAGSWGRNRQDVRVSQAGKQEIMWRDLLREFRRTSRENFSRCQRLPTFRDGNWMSQPPSSC